MINSDKLKLDEFILKLVLANARITVEGVGPVSQPKTVQQLINDLSDDTLKAFYKHLKKLPGSPDSPRRSGKKDWYVENLATAEELADIVDIILHDRETRQEKAKKQAKIKEIEAQMKALATPEELRQSLKEELAELQRSV